MTKQNSGMSRRRLIVGAAAGGVVLVGGAAGAMNLTANRAQLEAQIAKLQALIKLYEQLDKVGIDTIVSTGMNLVRTALDAVKVGIRLMRDGITAVETAIKNFQATLDTLKTAANNVSQILNDVSQKMSTAEGPIIAILGTAVPLAESIAGFFRSLLSKIPFVGSDITRAVDALVAFIRTVPNAITTISSQLLAPLRDMFFPLAGDSMAKTRLFDPIVQNVLEPLKKFLTDVENLIDKWENGFSKPVQDAIDQRKAIRSQIVAMRNEIGMA
jgi:hypothetical protein